MNKIKDQISNDIKKAMQDGNGEIRDTLRMLFSAIKDEEIKKKKREEGLNEEETIEIVARSVKQRKDSITEYLKGEREDLAEKEKSEIAILEKYLPEQLSEEDVRKEIKKIITETQATSNADFGRVMGMGMSKLKGKTDGQVVKKITEEELSQKG
jgi:uncharacterized protein